MTEERREDIRAISEDLVADSARLAEIERSKLDPGASNEELEKLSNKAVDLTRRMARKADIEKRVAAELT